MHGMACKQAGLTCRALWEMHNWEGPQEGRTSVPRLPSSSRVPQQPEASTQPPPANAATPASHRVCEQLRIESPSAPLFRR